MRKTRKLTPRTYVIVTEAVERGVGYGYMRAFKHTDTPDEEDIKGKILDAVMSEICEVIDFEGDER